MKFESGLFMIKDFKISISDIDFESDFFFTIQNPTITNNGIIIQLVVNHRTQVQIRKTYKLLLKWRYIIIYICKLVEYYKGVLWYKYSSKQ